jgi:hypothetical protein
VRISGGCWRFRTAERRWGLGTTPFSSCCPGWVCALARSPGCASTTSTGVRRRQRSGKSCPLPARCEYGRTHQCRDQPGPESPRQQRPHHRDQVSPRRQRIAPPCCGDVGIDRPDINPVPTDLAVRAPHLFEKPTHPPGLLTDPAPARRRVLGPRRSPMPAGTGPPHRAAAPVNPHSSAAR